MNMKIMVIHGPNLNLLGQREPQHYGNETLDQINQRLYQVAQELDIEIECHQTNSEGAFVELIQKGSLHVDGFILNPAAYTHTSIAIRDAILAVGIPAVEVHLSNPDKREPFRKVSYIADVVLARVIGFKSMSYELALRGLTSMLMDKKNSNVRV